MKYLITGLGNIGNEYAHTRHNIGFDVVDYLSNEAGCPFSDKRYGSVSEIKFKGRSLVLLKPSTYMNLSGNAVRYWMQSEKIPLENLLVVVDDLALEVGVLRMKTKGSDGGHNGLAHINQILGTNQYARLRVGIGNNFPKGRQVDFVLSHFSDDEHAVLNQRIPVAADMIKSFSAIGAERTMNLFNNK